MRCFFLLFSLGAMALFSGCMFSPLFTDYDENASGEGMRKLEAERMDRMRNNPSVNNAEYEAFNRQSGSTTMPGKPSIEDLERQVEAGRQTSR